MCCRRGPSPPSSSPARAQKSTRGTQDAGARRRERQPSGGTYGRIRCVAQLDDESERERERERVRLDRQCARERATWQGCVHVCVPAEGRVSVCTVARVFVGRVVRVRVGGGGARTRRTGGTCARGAWWWRSGESWRRSGPRHVCRLQRAGGHQSHGTCHIMSCTQPDTQPRP